MTEMTVVRVIAEQDIDLRVTKENVLGNGTFGIVFKTTFEGTQVAAKTFHIFTSPNLYGLSIDSIEYKNTIEEFQRECNTIANLAHPNVIQLIGVVNDSQQNTPKWMILELGETTLEKQLQTDPMFKQRLNNNNNDNVSSTIDDNNVQSLSAKLEIMKDILRGLCFIHQNNIIHCDIKPANIIKINNTYKLADIGIAKILQENDQQYVKSAKGTRLYVAPEVITNSKYTLKCDIYSIGVMMIEVILNEAPNLQTRNDQLQRAVSYIHDIITSIPQPQTQTSEDHSNNHHSINVPNVKYEKEWLENFLQSLIANDFNDRPSALETLSFIERLANYLPIYSSSFKIINIHNQHNNVDNKNKNNNVTIATLASHFQNLEIKMNDMDQGVQHKINKMNNKIRKMEKNISNILQLLESIQLQTVTSKCKKCDGKGKYHSNNYIIKKFHGMKMTYYYIFWPCCEAKGDSAEGCTNCEECGGAGTLSK